VREPRCPYCMDGDQFSRMTELNNEYYACENCGHKVAKTQSDFTCDCSNCLNWRIFVSERK
jgi:DNA-directed RNA polymerase subunit RPC12/RpoP